MSPGFPRFGLILGSATTTPNYPPTTPCKHSLCQDVPGKRGRSGQSWEQCKDLGIRAPTPVFAGEVKAFDTPGISLLLASKKPFPSSILTAAPPHAFYQAACPPGTPLWYSLLNCLADRIERAFLHPSLSSEICLCLLQTPMGSRSAGTLST